MQFKTYVEIPITVFFEMQKYIPRSFYEEGQSGGPGIDDIELPEDVKAYIFKHHEDQLIDECWDNIE